ncbi:hypothetical protein HY637_01215 [Candidatus Woesearchaeota archaeon]|nr:hypothetical protein [Candidatus Woesearchaeota archaeon]
MKKEFLFLLAILIVIYGCVQDGTSKEKTAEERLAEGDYTDKTTDHMVPKDYSELERNIDVLLQAGNMIGDRHYDELEAAVNKLERDGTDVSKLREKLANLKVYSRTGEEKAEIEINDLENKIRGLENEFAIIKKSNWQVSPEGYAEIEKKLKELERINDIRLNNLRQQFSMLKVGGTEAREPQAKNAAQTSSQNFKIGLLSPRGCEGNGSFLLGTSPIALEDLQKILPMGMMSTQHITPTDHQYFHTIEYSGPKDDTENLDRFRIYAPGDGEIVDVSTVYGREDYRIVIAHTCTFYTIFIHVDKLADKIAAAISQNGIIPEHSWERIPVKEGDVIGTIGIGKFDFSVVDEAVTLKGFARRETYDDERKGEVWKTHTVDTFDYFKEPVRSQLLAKNLRKVPPFGGKIDYDIDGKIVGNWFVEGTGGYKGLGNWNYWITHLSIVYDGLDTEHIVISIGEFEGRGEQFGVKGNAPNPKDVGVGTLVKYELVPYEYYSGNAKWDVINYVENIKAVNTNEVRGTVLFELIEGRRLKAEFFPRKTANQVSGFTSNAKVYER